MRLTHISIENFKSIGDRVEIPLRPITLLFGANSAGKSTILQALLYLRELLENQNPDADFLSASGAAIHLGGFLQMVHGHDLSKEIRVGVTMDLDDDGLPSYFDADFLPDSESSGEDEEDESYEPLYKELTSVHLEISVRWNPQSGGAEICSYQLSDDWGEIAWIKPEAFGKQRLIFPDFHDVYRVQIELVAEGRENDIPFRTPVHFSPAESLILTQPGVVPRWHHPLVIEESEEEKCGIFRLKDVRRLLSPVIVGSGELVLQQLRKIRYIGPVRQFPERSAAPRRTPSQDRWANGLAAWDWLGQHSTNPKHLSDLENFRDLISEKIGLELGYSVDVVGSRRILDDSLFHDQLIALRYATEPEEELERLKQLIEKTYLKLPVERRVVITDLRNRTEVSPQDVGNGVTQVIPVIAGVVAPGAPILAVEQPELHLHPAIQCRLADIFIRAIRGSEERLLLLESHSEHLMLRLMRRIRETGEGESPEPHLALRPEDLSVVYVEAIPEGVKMTVLPLTEDGDFSTNWPAGFFEERAAELF